MCDLLNIKLKQSPSQEAQRNFSVPQRNEDEYDARVVYIVAEETTYRCLFRI